MDSSGGGVMPHRGAGDSPTKKYMSRTSANPSAVVRISSRISSPFEFSEAHTSKDIGTEEFIHPLSTGFLDDSGEQIDGLVVVVEAGAWGIGEFSRERELHDIWAGLHLIADAGLHA